MTFYDLKSHNGAASGAHNVLRQRIPETKAHLFHASSWTVSARIQGAQGQSGLYKYVEETNLIGEDRQ